MMKVLHASLAFNNLSLGIKRQILSEIRACSEGGVGIDTIVLSNVDEEEGYIHKIEGVGSSLAGMMLFRKKAYNKIVDICDSYDAVMVRSTIADPLRCVAIDKINTKSKVLSVHHTFELEEAKLDGGVKGRAKYAMEDFFGGKSLKKVDGIVAVTREIMNYEMDRAGKKYGVVYPNGILYKEGNLAHDRRGGVPEVLFMASNFRRWQGLDYILKSLKENEDVDVIIHIVGRVDSEIIANIEGDGRVVLHGVLEGNDIYHVLERCWVGLSSFNLQAKNMSEACTLKVRDYLSSGLPVYSGHKDAALPYDFPYYRMGDPNIENILRFAYSVRDVSRKEISEAAKPFIDKRVLVRKLYNDLLEVV